MTDPAPPPNALSTHVEPAKRDLAALATTGLITTEQQRALTTATTNLHQLRNVATAPGQRHFNKVDTLIAVRGNTPIAQARECLSQMGAAWDGLSKDFHHYQKLYAEARLRRAKLAKRQKELEAITDPDDRTIAEAEIDLERAQIAELESEVARGEADLRARLAKVTKTSEQYELIVKQSGKTEFTEADFRAEEIDYYLKSAWWHAAQVYELVDTRDELTRDYAENGSKAWNEEGLERGKIRAQRFLRRLEQFKHSQIRVKEEVALYFQGLGIHQHEIEAELRKLLEMRESFNYVPGNNGRDFTAHFEGWLTRATQAFRPHAVRAIDQHGFERVQRIGKLLNPDEADGGDHGDVGAIKRGSGVR